MVDSGDVKKEPYWWKFIREGLRVAEQVQPWLEQEDEQKEKAVEVGVSDLKV